jgi:calcium-dependent protein kinase
LHAFWAVGLKNMSEVELDRVLSYVDNDQNGFITFGEFIVASVSRKDILTKERITACFKSFDDDGSGAISLMEIKAIIGKLIKLPEHIW